MMGKAMGLALAAILALSAVAAPGALGKYDSEKSSVELVGIQQGAHTLKTKFGNLVCQKAEFTGIQKGTSTGDGNFTSNHVTVHPTYSNCKMLGFDATVTTTGCDYTFTPATKTESTGPHAQVDIVKSGAESCTIKIEAVGKLCTVLVPAQNEVGLMDFMNEGAGSTRDVVVDSTVNNIIYLGAEGPFCFGPGGGGIYEGAATIKGFSGGVQVGIWITNT